MKPKILCIVPISKNSQFNHKKIGDKELFWFTVESALNSQLIDKIVICSDDLEIKEKVKDKDLVFLERPDELTHSTVTGEQILKYAVEEMQKEDNYEVVVFLEITHPFRKKGFIDNMITTFLKENLDTIFTAYEDKSPYWKSDSEGYRRVDEDYVRSKFRKPLYKELKGLGSITHSKNIIDRVFFGKKIGIIPVKDIASLIDIKTEDDLFLARAICNKQ